MHKKSDPVTVSQCGYCADDISVNSWSCEFILKYIMTVLLICEIFVLENVLENSNRYFFELCQKYRKCNRFLNIAVTFSFGSERKEMRANRKAETY